jgi:WD40 repeat protein
MFELNSLDIIIAICAKNENLIRFHSGKDGTIISSLAVVQKGTTITDLQFNTNSKILVFSADDSTTGIVKPSDNKVDQIFSDHDRNYSCNSISINLNDNLIASGSADGHLVVRSLRDG